MFVNTFLHYKNSIENDAAKKTAGEAREPYKPWKPDEKEIAALANTVPISCQGMHIKLVHPEFWIISFYRPKRPLKPRTDVLPQRRLAIATS